MAILHCLYPSPIHPQNCGELNDTMGVARILRLSDAAPGLCSFKYARLQAHSISICVASPKQTLPHIPNNAWQYLKNHAENGVPHAIDKGQRAAVHFYAFPLLWQCRMRYIGTGAQALPEILIFSPPNLRQTQQRQSHTGQIPASRADERSPHSNVSKDSNPPRYSSSKPLGSGLYPKQQPSYPFPPLHYDFLHPSATGDSDLTMAIPGTTGNDWNPINSHQQGAPTEYGFYYLARDSFADCPYFGPYGSSDPNVYEFGGVPMSPATCAYDASPQSPMMSSQLPFPSAPMKFAAKKLQIQAKDVTSGFRRSLGLWLANAERSNHIWVQPIFDILWPVHDARESAPTPHVATPSVIMMKDQYGNYVLQRVLGVTEGDQKETLINTVRPQLLSMQRYSTAYSKHLTSIKHQLERLSP
ncbi:hypothetical protein B0H13DRAFT_2671181 [Mycena leptocephala]|nr:hypothetical protein B0H13DRAFT_2671181 [Mycena leptocephala]